MALCQRISHTSGVSEAVLMWSLGGRAGISAAVYKLYERVENDEQLSPYFRDVNLVDLRAHMVDFLIAALTGADHVYRGRPLEVAHADMSVTDSAFDRVVIHLQNVLAEHHVDGEAIAQVAARLAPLRSRVVTVES